MKAMQQADRIVEDEDCSPEELMFRVQLRAKHHDWQVRQALTLAGRPEEHSGLPAEEHFGPREHITVSVLNYDGHSHTCIVNETRSACSSRTWRSTVNMPCGTMALGQGEWSRLTALIWSLPVQPS